MKCAECQATSIVGLFATISNRFVTFSDACITIITSHFPAPAREFCHIFGCLQHNNNIEARGRFNLHLRPRAAEIL